MEPPTWQYMCQTGAAEFPGRSCSEDRLEAIAGCSSLLGHEHRTARCPGAQDGRTVISVVAYLPGQMEALPRRRPGQTETGLARFGLIDV